MKRRDVYLKLTRHNGRAGTHGTYNPKHNDRSFNLANSEHIDPERAKGNIYWDCFHGFRSALAPQDPDDLAATFSDVERQFYESRYSNFVESQNERNAKIRHTERNRSIPDLLSSRKTCPEETIYQLGTLDEHASAEDLLNIVTEFIEAFKAKYGRGTISVSKTMQRANKDALEKLDPNQVYHTFPDRREGSKSSLILKKPKTKKSNRVLYMTKPLKEELQAWLEKLKQDEQNAPEKYSNCGQLFRLPDGLPIAPELLTKWYRLWRAEHPEFEQIVFHGLRHSSATYQLLQSDGDFKSVQGNTGHATAAVLMDTYAHTQDKPRLELTEKIEANFYSQDLTPVAPQPRKNEKPAATKISGKEILEAIRLMDADERRELTRALFA